jgi:hypothetical protein
MTCHIFFILTVTSTYSTQKRKYCQAIAQSHHPKATPQTTPQINAHLLETPETTAIHCPTTSPYNFYLWEKVAQVPLIVAGKEAYLKRFPRRHPQMICSLR